MKNWICPPWIGNPDQQLQVRRFRLQGGRSEGLECVGIEASCGLSITIATGRAMAIQSARFCGKNITYLPPAGPTGPDAVWELEHYFEGGLLFDCGLDNAGPGNGAYGTHGLLRRFAADQVSIDRLSESGVPCVEVSGRVIQSGLGLPTLILERTIRVRDDQPVIHIRDKIYNASCREAGFMHMYHCNFGWPLLSESAVLQIPSVSVTPKNEVSAKDLDRCLEIYGPKEDWKPQAFYHLLDENAELVEAQIRNPEVGLAVKVCVNPRELPCLTEWRCFRAGEYVLGIEPCVTFPLGRTYLEQTDGLAYIAAGEEKEYHLKIEIDNI